MICPRCGADHPRGCKQHVESLTDDIVTLQREIEALKTDNSALLDSLAKECNVTCDVCAKRAEQTRLRVARFRSK